MQKESCRVRSTVLDHPGASGLFWKPIEYSRYFSRHVKEQRDDGRLFIAIDNESHFIQSLSEVSCVFCKLPYSLQPWKETDMKYINSHQEERSKGQTDLASTYVFLQACIISWEGVKIGWGNTSWWAGMGTDVWELFWVWKPGSSGVWCC